MYKLSFIKQCSEELQQEETDHLQEAMKTNPEKPINEAPGGFYEWEEPDEDWQAEVLRGR